MVGDLQQVDPVRLTFLELSPSSGLYLVPNSSHRRQRELRHFAITVQGIKPRGTMGASDRQTPKEATWELEGSNTTIPR